VVVFEESGIRKKLMKQEENRFAFPSCFMLFWLIMVAEMKKKLSKPRFTLER
jgi:hypothetical protein